MSSPGGTAADINPQDAMDLLHKLVTELTKVQGVFRSASVLCTVVGFIKVAPDGQLSVQEFNAIGTSLIMFNPTAASIFKYGDTRAFSGDSGIEGAPRFTSALSLIFGDGTQLTLFEIAAGGR